MVLTKHLPRDCALARAVLGERASWTHNEELLASLIEVVDRGQLWWVQAHAKKGAKRPSPIVIPRPAATDDEPAPAPVRQSEAKKSTGEALRELLATTGGG